MSDLIERVEQKYTSNIKVKILFNTLIIFFAGIFIFKNQLFYSYHTISDINILKDEMINYKEADDEYIPISQDAIIDIENITFETNQITVEFMKNIDTDANISIYKKELDGTFNLIDSKSIKRTSKNVSFKFQKIRLYGLQVKITSLDASTMINVPKVNIKIEKRNVSIFQKNIKNLLIYLLILLTAFILSLMVVSINKEPNKNSNAKDRESNIELLRVISMFLIILHHCIVHGGAINIEYCGNKLVANTFVPIGKICFDAFIAISMWFLVDNKFKVNRFIKTWLQVAFYSIVFTFIALLFGKVISIKEICSSFLPIAGNSHGYAAAYLLFYLLYPFLHMLLDLLNKNRARFLLLLAFYTQICSQIIGNYNGYKQNFASEIGLFIFCFILSYNLKKWPPKFTTDYSINLIIFISCWLLCIQANAMLYFWGSGSKALEFVLNLAQDESSLIMILGGYCFFFFMLNIKIKKSKIINRLAEYTFGILLIHDHNFFRSIFWNDIIITKEWFYSSFFIIRLIITGIIIFYVCAVIDFLRQSIFEKFILKSKIYSKAISLYDERCN